MQIRKFIFKKKGKAIEAHIAIPENFLEISQTMGEQETYNYWLAGYLEGQKRAALGIQTKQRKKITLSFDKLTPLQIQGLMQLGLLQAFPGEPVDRPPPAAPIQPPEPAPTQAEVPAPPAEPDPGLHRPRPEHGSVLAEDPEEVLSAPSLEGKSDEEWASELGVPNFDLPVP